MTDETDITKIAKLPKWARDHIRRLDAKIQRLETANQHLRGTNRAIEDSPGYIYLNGYGDEPVPLGKHFRVTCTAGPGAGVEACMEGDSFVARTNDGWMAIVPSVSNVVHLRRLDRA